MSFEHANAFTSLLFTCAHVVSEFFASFLSLVAVGFVRITLFFHLQIRMFQISLCMRLSLFTTIVGIHTCLLQVLHRLCFLQIRVLDCSVPVFCDLLNFFKLLTHWINICYISDPTSCVFASTTRDHPIHLWDSISGQVMNK